MVRSVTQAKEYVSNGIWNHFTGLKKWTITCGNCDHSWVEKVPIKEICSAICPCCEAQNKWSAKAFEDRYNKWLEARKNQRQVDEQMAVN